jgi:hypothetical protein
MNIAIIVGHGRKARLVRESRRSGRLPSSFLLYRTNFSDPSDECKRLRILDLAHAHKREDMRRALWDRNVRGVIMVGCQKLATADHRNPDILELADIIGRNPAGSISELIKDHIRTVLGASFEYPAVEAVLPMF